jgi:hypothetical protein
MPDASRFTLSLFDTNASSASFPLQGELDAKLDQIAEIEADLAATEGVAGETRVQQAELRKPDHEPSNHLLREFDRP